jgi:hypothetical protein
MSVPSIALRPAVDTRPPAEEWSRSSSALLHAVPPNQPPLRLVEASEAMTGPPVPTRTPITVDVVPAGVVPHRISELENQARTWAPWFAQLLAEALEGRRPLESLGRWLDDWVLAEVSRRVRLQRRARSRTTAPVPPATVISLRSQFSQPRVLEVAAHLRRGRRSHAWAFQLIRVGDRWRCAALQLGDDAAGGSASR